MKELVITNLVQYATENNVSKTLSELVLDIMYHEENEYVVEELDASFIWYDIVNALNIDKISVKLLENFSHAVDNEDYKSLSLMKEEVSNRWDFDEDKVIGVLNETLVDLLVSVSSSKLLNNHSDKVV